MEFGVAFKAISIVILGKPLHLAWVRCLIQFAISQSFFGTKTKDQNDQLFSFVEKYPNLIREFVSAAINQLWVSVITYWKLKNGPIYISFILNTDSNKILGINWQLH